MYKKADERVITGWAKRFKGVLTGLAEGFDCLKKRVKSQSILKGDK